jgi:hypothetical protein
MCSLCLELVCLRHSILLCNVAFFYSFSSFPKLLKKTKTIKYTPKGRREKYFLFFGSTMSRPWTKYILSFVCQALGFNMTLGSCSCYIELCPPPFGYSSKHMESLCCLLHRELMSTSRYLSLIICRAIVRGKFLSTLSRPLSSLSLSLMPDHLESPIKSLFEVHETLILIIKIL